MAVLQRRLFLHVCARGAERPLSRRFLLIRATQSLALLTCKFTLALMYKSQFCVTSAREFPVHMPGSHVDGQAWELKGEFLTVSRTPAFITGTTAGADQELVWAHKSESFELCKVRTPCFRRNTLCTPPDAK